MSYRPLVVRKGGVYVGTLNGVVDIGNVFTVGTDANGGITLDLSLTSASVGLGNVTNTSDANKPVSTAQQTALNLKANLAGPTFTGIPLAPTASNGTNTTQIATTGFTQNTVSTYVRSRGQNLVTNGTALLGNNFNFTGFAFNGADTYNGGGSFEVTSLPGVKTSDELLPVNSDNRYRLTAYGRWTGGAQQPNIYIGLMAHDIDGNGIGPGHYMRQSDDVLAAPLKPGDTTMTVATPSSWNNAAGVDTRLRTVVVWGYKNSFGYKYPAYTYSRFSIPNAYADGGVNSSTGVITLAAPFPAGYGNPDDANGIWPTGTPVSNGSSGGTYQYIAAGGTPVPQTWTKYSGTIQGIETSGNTATTKFPPATSAIKILFLVNYGTTVAQTTRVSNIEFALDTLGGVGSGLDADTLDGFQGSYFAPVASPSLTGIPLAPTATAGTNTTQLATTAFVTTALSNGAPTKTGGGASGSWAISVTGSAATLTTARTISTTGDATWTTTFNGSANVTGALTLATVATPGTYRSVTVNAKGLVTSGTNPTTLSGYGITDATPSARQVIAGNGVTGGGALTADVTVTLGTPGTITSATTNAVTTTSHTHALTVTKADVGLANVDNTSDLSKPVSTATQTALDLKANATAPSFTGTMTMTGHIIPATDITYDLGSPTKMWRDLYVGPGSIYMNGKKILEDNSNTITFSTDDNQNLRIETAGTGNLEMKTGTGGAIMMQGTINVSSGKKIIDSAGIKIEFGDDIDVGNNFVISTPIPTAVSHLTNKAYVDSLTTGDTTIVRTTGAQTIGGNKTFTGDVVLSGNLTINGTTTTINTETISLADNIIELNSNFTVGTPTENSGFVVRRGDLGTVSWIWDEANDRFTAINGSNALQDLYVGAITATTYNGVTKASVGLANVDNTSDVNKPVSTAQQSALDLKAPLASPTFTGTVSGITKTMVGLANVDNTADTAKPVSTAQQTALNLKANIASPTFTGTTTTAILTATGLVTTPASVAGSAGFNVPPGVAPTTPVNGDIWTTTAGGVFARVNGVTQNLVPTTQLASYATLASPTFTGTVGGITAAMVGLGNVNNTADSAKPVSTAQQTALDLKAPLASPTFTGTVSGITKAMVGLGNVDNTADTAKPVSSAQQTALNLKANLASPTFTGTVSGITSAMVGLGNVTNTSDANKPVSTAQQAALDLKANLASPAFTGTVDFSGTTSVLGLSKASFGLGNADNTSDVNKPVSTAQQAALDLKANLASPIFTGIVTSAASTTGGASINIPHGVAPTTPANGDIWTTSAGGVFAQINGVTQTLISSTALSSYAPLASPTFTGTVSGITATMVGLGNVTNTSDANKPVSTAQQTALNLKANAASPTFTGTVTLPAQVELGLQGSANTPFIDFHSGATNTDYDSRIIASGGTGVNGAGTLTLTAATVGVSSALTVGTTVTASTFIGALTGLASKSQVQQATDNRLVKPSDISGNTTVGYGSRTYFSSRTGMETGTAGSDYVDVLTLSGYVDASGGSVNALAFRKNPGGGIFHYEAAWNSATWNTPKQLAYTNSDITGNASTATSAATLTTARTIALSGAATGTATSFNGSANITIPVTSLNAPNLAGIVPNANLSGLYDGVTIKATGNNVLFTDVSVGSSSVNGRTVYGLASYESYNTPTGAIVFYAPSAAITVMHMLEINGFVYNTANAVKIVTNAYRYQAAAYANVSATNYGNISIPVRWAIDPAGKTCVILGDVTTAWSYPHFTISTALISAGVTDAYCVGWTTALVTDLSTYTQITTATEKPSVVTALNATSSTTLTTARTIAISGVATGTATSFNGSANITIPVTSLDLTNAGMSGILGVDHGSTGQSAYAIGDMLYASGTTALSKLSAGSANQVLQANGAGIAPSWTTLDMSYMPDSVFKKSVKAATTANITLSAPQTIDGVSLIAGDRVLVKNQTTSAQNGIWAVAAAAWVRVTDADISSEIAGAVVSVDQGAINGGLLFTNTFKTTDTLGTTAMVWQTVTTNEAAQTLTNKTLTSPTITNPSFTGVTNFPASNAQIEIGAQGTANTPFIDFHSGATTTDYDSRIIASGGTGVTGAGTLTLTAATVATTSNLNVGGIITGNLTGNVTGNVSGSSGSTTGNSATATILQTARTISIAGAVSGTATSFNGSANISIPITSVDLTSTAYAGILGVDHGSTGIGAYAVGDLLQASGTTALARLPAVATGNVLLSGGVATSSSWGKVGLTTHVTGALPIANGGTGTTTAAGGLTALGGVAKAGDTMTGALNFAAEATLASASTTSIGAANSNNIYITGSATITSLGLGTIGMTRKVRFAGNAVLAYSATFMILIGGVTFITQPNDCAEFMCIGTSNWIMTDYIRATASVDGVAALGGGTDKVFYENDQSVNSSYSITSGRNAMTAGPITINNGAVVTVPDGSVWSIV